MKFVSVLLVLCLVAQADARKDRGFGKGRENHDHDGHQDHDHDGHMSGHDGDHDNHHDRDHDDHHKGDRRHRDDDMCYCSGTWVDHSEMEWSDMIEFKDEAMQHYDDGLGVFEAVANSTGFFGASHAMAEEFMEDVMWEIEESSPELMIEAYEFGEEIVAFAEALGYGEEASWVMEAIFGDFVDEDDDDDEDEDMDNYDDVDDEEDWDPVPAWRRGQKEARKDEFRSRSESDRSEFFSALEAKKDSIAAEYGEMTDEKWAAVKEEMWNEKNEKEHNHAMKFHERVAGRNGRDGGEEMRMKKEKMMAEKFDSFAEDKKENWMAENEGATDEDWITQKKTWWEEENAFEHSHDAREKDHQKEMSFEEYLADVADKKDYWMGENPTATEEDWMTQVKEWFMEEKSHDGHHNDKPHRSGDKDPIPFEEWSVMADKRKERWMESTGGSDSEFEEVKQVWYEEMLERAAAPRREAMNKKQTAVRTTWEEFSSMVDAKKEGWIEYTGRDVADWQELKRARFEDLSADEAKEMKEFQGKWEQEGRHEHEEGRGKDKKGCFSDEAREKKNHKDAERKEKKKKDCKDRAEHPLGTVEAWEGVHGYTAAGDKCVCGEGSLSNVTLEVLPVLNGENMAVDGSYKSMVAATKDEVHAVASQFLSGRYPELETEETLVVEAMAVDVDVEVVLRGLAFNEVYWTPQTGDLPGQFEGAVATVADVDPSRVVVTGAEVFSAAGDVRHLLQEAGAATVVRFTVLDAPEDAAEVLFEALDEALFEALAVRKGFETVKGVDIAGGSTQPRVIVYLDRGSVPFMGEDQWAVFMIEMSQMLLENFGPTSQSSSEVGLTDAEKARIAAVRVNCTYEGPKEEEEERSGCMTGMRLIFAVPILCVISLAIFAARHIRNKRAQAVAGESVSAPNDVVVVNADGTVSCVAVKRVDAEPSKASSKAGSAPGWKCCGNSGDVASPNGVPAKSSPRSDSPDYWKGPTKPPAN